MHAVAPALRRSASGVPWSRLGAVGALVAVVGVELALTFALVHHPSQRTVPNAGILFHGRWAGDPFSLSRSALPRDTVPGRLVVFALLGAMSAAYLGVLALARHIGLRVAVVALGVALAIVGMAPILLSKDAFLYLAFARLGAVHHLNPYLHPPAAAPHDVIVRFIDWHHEVTPYGPLFTLATYPLGRLSVPTAIWVLKLVAVGAAGGVLALLWRCAERLRRPALPAVLAVGLNPLFLVYAVGGAHNDLLLMLLLVLGLYLVLSARAVWGGAAAAAGIAVKAAAAPIAPFLLVASRRRGHALAGAAIALGVVAAVTLPIFGTHLLGFRQQANTVDMYSVPRLVGSPFGVRATISCAQRGIGCQPHPVELVAALLLAAVVAFLLYRVWRGADPVAAGGWSALALTASLASIMPWYLAWTLPLAALSRSRALQACTGLMGVFLLITSWPGRELLLP